MLTSLAFADGGNREITRDMMLEKAGERFDALDANSDGVLSQAKRMRGDRPHGQNARTDQRDVCPYGQR